MLLDACMRDTRLSTHCTLFCRINIATHRLQQDIYICALMLLLHACLLASSLSLASNIADPATMHLARSL